MIFTTQTISYTYDKLNQLTSVSNYGNLGLDGSSIEYFYDDDVMTDTYPLDVEPWEQNISTRVNFASKWKDMLPSGTPIPTPIAEKKEISRRSI